MRYPPEYKSNNRFYDFYTNPGAGGRYYSQYHRNYEDLYKRLTGGARRQSGSDATNAFSTVTAGGGVPQNVLDYYTRATGEYRPRSVDPQAAIEAARQPIEAQRNEQFSAVNARLGRLGGMGGTPHALGLGRVAQQSANEIAAMTQSNLLNAAKFNISSELAAEKMRRDAELAAASGLLGAQQSDYDRALRAALANQETTMRYDLSNADRLASLAARLAELGYGGEQAEFERDWRTGERIGTQSWQSGERMSDRDWQTRERLGTQSWQSGEREKGQDWQRRFAHDEWLRRLGINPYTFDERDDPLDALWRRRNKYQQFWRSW